MLIRLKLIFIIIIIYVMYLFRKSKLFLAFSIDECHLKNSDFYEIK